MRSAALVAASLCGGGCLAADSPAPPVSEERRPLIGGEVPTEDDDLAAVALTSPSNFSFCTGTLVSPRVVLTAAHCIDMAAGDPAVVVFFGTDINAGGTRIGVQRARAHPEWTGNLADNHDIGLMLMNFRAPEEAEPVPLFTGDLSQHLGDAVRRIGFGIYDAESGESDGRKRIGTTTIHEISSQDWFYAGDENLITCQGDSGGPALLTVDGTEYVAGVHSFGFGCTSGDNGDTRVDLYAESFVSPWIQENDPTCGEDGVCAESGCMDDPDCVPCGPDGTCAQDCALPDVDCPTQEIGEICQGDSQCASGVCVYWEGDQSYHFCTRDCDPGAGDCPAGMSCQSVTGYGDVCYYDEEPDGVLGDACEEPTDCGSYQCEEGLCVTDCDLSVGQGCPSGFACDTPDGENYYCLAEEAPMGGGGCSCRASGGGPGWPLLVLLALALGRGILSQRRAQAADLAASMNRIS